MSERPLQVGDLVVVIVSMRGLEGYEGVVKEIRDPNRPVINPEKNIFVLLNGVHSGTATGCYRYEPRQLRRIPPKSDFEKAEDWFIEDLMRTIKRRERV